jgi:hypothetical protein
MGCRQSAKGGHQEPHTNHAAAVAHNRAVALKRHISRPAPLLSLHFSLRSLIVEFSPIMFIRHQAPKSFRLLLFWLERGHGGACLRRDIGGVSQRPTFNCRRHCHPAAGRRDFRTNRQRRAAPHPRRKIPERQQDARAKASKVNGARSSWFTSNVNLDWTSPAGSIFASGRPG